MVTSLARAWWCILICLPLVAGCDGCRFTRPPDEEAKQNGEQQPPFTSRAADAYPASRPDVRSGGSPNGSVKPGHWTSARLSMRSNRDDRRGVVQTRTEVGDSQNNLDENPRRDASESPFSNSFLVRRPAVLPKGQMRRLETRFLAPSRGSQMIDNVILDGQFLGHDSNARFDLRPARFAAMAPQTYFLVILTQHPERFTRWQTADWIRPMQSTQFGRAPPDNYRIVIPPTDGVLPIAETVLDWTSTAVVLWDDLSITALTPGQRTAILDWLYFGGLIVVNGPAGVDSLTDSQFRELLPITPGGATELLAEVAQSFVRSQSVASDPSTADVIEGFDGNASRVATAGKKRAEAFEIGAGELVLERRVGRGRIVQTRMDLLSPWLMPWKSYDSFVNSAILARPPRVFRLDPIDPDLALPNLNAVLPGQPSVSPDESTEPSVAMDASLPLRQNFVGADIQSTSPAMNTGVRLFSRDARMRARPNASVGSQSQTVEKSSAAASPLAAWRSDDVAPNPVSGLGGWTNDSDLLTWSQSQLRKEIGVSIPESSLVFRSLLIYLFVLIPLNYLVFRLLGHLEWAWLAVVPLSIVGAFWVAHAAQLDVGFARSRNEVALLEIPVDYARGHLTRVVGLYNSLASQYRVDFDSPDAAIDVIRSRGSAQSQASLFGATEAELELGFESGPSMNNIGVGSNSYGVVHAEQIIDVDGAISVKPASLTSEEVSFDEASIMNDSSLELLDAFVIQRDAQGRARMAAMGTIGSHASKSIRLQAIDRVVVPSDLPMGMTDAMDRLLAIDAIPAGSARLVARLEQPLGGMTISPDCKQVRAQTLVLVHLSHPRRPPVTSDKNLVGDVLP